MSQDNLQNNEIVIAVTERTVPIIDRGNAIVIETPDQLIEATEILSQVNKAMDQVKAEKEKVLGPLRELANREKARWEPLEALFKPVIERLRTQMSAYQTAALKKKAEDDAKIAARVGEGRGKLKATTAIQKMTDNAVDEKIETSVGGLSFREKKVLKITNAAIVPDIYWIIDEDAVLKAIKEGTLVEGARLETIQVPVNSRK